MSVDTTGDFVATASIDGGLLTDILPLINILTRVKVRLLFIPQLPQSPTYLT
jgi:hypothetical protein